MDQELKVYFPSGLISRKYLLLFLIFGLGSSLVPLFLAQPDTPEVWCINWNAIFGQIYVYARLAASVISRYLRNYYKNYGTLRILLYLTFVSCFSYICVVHGLDQAATMTWEWLEGNVVRRLDDSVIIIDENRNESTSMRRVQEKPKSIEEHFRYNGEDVYFYCYDAITFDVEVEPADKPVIWRHDGELVLPSDKVKIQFTFLTAADKTIGEHNSTLYTYVIESTLKIYLVEDSDFGNYTCHLRQTAKGKHKVSQTKPRKQRRSESRKQQMPKPVFKRHHSSVFPPCICRCICILISLEDVVRQFEEMLSEFYSYIEVRRQMQMFNENLRKTNIYDWTGEFMLTKINKTVLTRSAPPGGIVSMSLSYLNLAEKQDVSLDYVINDKAFHEVCTGNLNGCSLFVWIYWAFWHAKGHFGTLPNMFLYWLNMQSSILGIAWHCACPSSYGSHVFLFYRHFYNVTSGRNEVIEVEHPQSIKLIPRTPDILLAFQNESKPMLLGDSLSIMGSYYWLTYIQELHRNYFLIENMIFFGLLVFGVLITYAINKLMVRLIVACRNVILEGPFWHGSRVKKIGETLGSIGHLGLSCKYDVYISHADSQRDLASAMASILESFGNKVFYRERDVAIGDYKTESVSNAIVSSRMFLIIVSKEYIESGFQNGFEFQLMLYQINEKQVAGKNVMLLKHGPCNISTYFGFTDMKILDMNKLCPEEFSKLFKNWFIGQESNKTFLSVITLSGLCACLGIALFMPKQVIVTAINVLKTLFLFWLEDVSGV
ncbi:uncharacterized protein LOC121381077 [Gigantopelta aegis]|uniref:uncharacterized protein LOC121381077 n=1 Tax=Gigantopelta aegis TaxID=1735272 RepID=UPI001B88C9DC|nr:uncharacterized protein LOC121381077 [Gigantopelta aegis]XP_041366108.1 uncharacterized protein LOC121381077 [Gigantopelta aegis]